MLRSQALLICVCCVVIASYGLLFTTLLENVPLLEEPADLAACADCLPDAVTLDSRCQQGSTTVGERLQQLGAFVQDGAVVARDGTPIYLVSVQSLEAIHVRRGRCGDHFMQLREARRRDEARLRGLEKQGIVIVCQPAASPDQKLVPRA